jgi:hypothetical protein
VFPVLCLKAGRMEPEETVVARQLFGKHFLAPTTVHIHRILKKECNNSNYYDDDATSTSLYDDGLTTKDGLRHTIRGRIALNKRNKQTPSKIIYVS